MKWIQYESSEGVNVLNLGPVAVFFVESLEYFDYIKFKYPDGSFRTITFEKFDTDGEDYAIEAFNEILRFIDNDKESLLSIDYSI